MTLQIAELSPLTGTVGELTSVGADHLQAPSWPDNRALARPANDPSGRPLSGHAHGVVPPSVL
jgi:hypothetical protein